MTKPDSQRAPIVPARTEVPDEAVKAWNAVIDQAVAWWKGRRPLRWNKARHLRNPTINTATPREGMLAEAVANLIKQGWK